MPATVELVDDKLIRLGALDNQVGGSDIAPPKRNYHVNSKPTIEMISLYKPGSQTEHTF